MDFEIEDDDPYNFESNWSKPTKKGYFGASGFAADSGGGDDVYDYDFGGGGIKAETTHYSSSPESYSKPQKKDNKPTSASTAPVAIKEKVTASNALEKAQSMLSKYSTKTAAKKPAPKKYNDDFDEDDISLGSDDFSDDGNAKRPMGFATSPGPVEVNSKFKPSLTKQATSRKTFDLDTEVWNDDIECLSGCSCGYMSVSCPISSNGYLDMYVL